MRKIALLFVIMIGLTRLVISAESPKQITLEQAKSEYQNLQLAAAEKYGKILDAELEKATEAGNLDLVTEIQAEKEAISGAETNTTNKEWKKSKTLAIAAKNFNGDLDKTKKSYVASLEKVIMEFTKQKKINEAKEVKGLVDYLKNDIFYGTWIISEDCTLVINRDGTCYRTCNGIKDHTGKWKIDRDVLSTNFFTNKDYVLKIIKRNDGFIGQSYMKRLKEWERLILKADHTK